MNIDDEEFLGAYERDGFIFPYPVIGASAACEIRADLEAAESELANAPEKLALLRAYPDRVLPSFDALIRHPRLVAAAQKLLGPDLVVWSAGLFIKEANTPSYVSWHQDLNYWGLDDAREVTAWVALSPSTVASGCMRFIPGSHVDELQPHKDSFAPDNLLSRGQELAVKVDESKAVDIILQSGQASLHHGHLFHGSNPNSTSDRRIGAAIRYMPTSMKQTTGDRSLVALVSGEDRYDHFTIAPAPAGRLLDENFEQCRIDATIKRKILYAGAEQNGGQRYR